MRRRRKLIHVKSDFGQQAPGRHPVDSWNGAQPIDVLLVRGHSPSDFLLHLIHTFFGKS